MKLSEVRARLESAGLKPETVELGMKVFRAQQRVTLLNEQVKRQTG